MATKKSTKVEKTERKKEYERSCRASNVIGIKEILDDNCIYNYNFDKDVFSKGRPLNVEDVFTRLMQTLSTNQILPSIKLDYVSSSFNFKKDEMFDNLSGWRIYAGIDGKTVFTRITAKHYVTLGQYEGVSEDDFVSFEATSDNGFKGRYIDYLKMLQIGGIVKLLLTNEEVFLPQGEMRLDYNIIYKSQCSRIKEKTDNIQVNGHIGTWYVIDTKRFCGNTYFLLKHKEYGNKTDCVIVNEIGALVAEDIRKGFNDKNFKDEKNLQKEMYLIKNRNFDNIKVKGHIGMWYVVDIRTFGSINFFLLEHKEHGDEIACVIIDETGALVAEDIWNGFEDENFKNEKKIKQYLKSEQEDNERGEKLRQKIENEREKIKAKLDKEEAERVEQLRMQIENQKNQIVEEQKGDYKL